MLKFLLLVLIFVWLPSCHHCDIDHQAETTEESTTTTPLDFSCLRTYGSVDRIGECKPAEECLGAIYEGTCQNSRFSCCYADPRTPGTIANYPIISLGRFLQLFGNTSRNQLMYEWFAESLDLAGIDRNDKYQLAAYLSQMADESRNFLKFESGYLDADNYELIGNFQEQDGVNYQSRGAIYLRGRANYFAANQVLGPSIISRIYTLLLKNYV